MKGYQTRTAVLAAVLLLAVLAGPAAATPLSLTSLGASGAIGDAFFQQVNHQATGSGVIDPFVRIQQSGSEQGFNTSARPLIGDLANVNNSATFTHPIFVSDFGVVDRAGTPSIRFLLDINQQGSSPLLSLDRFRVYTADAGDIHTNATLFAQNLIYDMGEGNKIYLDYSLEHGSGSGDMLACLPASMFAGLGGKHLYLYSQFGATGGDYASNDGFEEWARIDSQTPTAPVPEAPTYMLLGGGMLALLTLRWRTAS